MVDEKLLSDFSYPASPGDYFPPILGDPGEEEAAAAIGDTDPFGSGRLDLPRPQYSNLPLYVCAGIWSSFPTLTTLDLSGTSADVLVAYPLVAPDWIVQEISVEVATAAPAGSKIRAGIYASVSQDNIRPGALLTETGELDISSTGNKAVVLAQPLEARRVYWAAYVKNGSASSGILRAVDTEIRLGYTVLSAAATAASSVRATHTFAALPTQFPGTVTIGSVNSDRTVLFFKLRGR